MIGIAAVILFMASIVVFFGYAFFAVSKRRNRDRSTEHRWDQSDPGKQKELVSPLKKLSSVVIFLWLLVVVVAITGSIYNSFFK